MINSWQNLLPEKCDWCPLECGANRAGGNVGLCGADDKLFCARHSLHYWEEPPISGTIGGPQRDQGPGSGTIFFSNCNIKCSYCQNYKISGVNENTIGQDTSLDELVDMMFELQNLGAMNINFVTGTHYRSHIISAIRLARQKALNLPIVWNTSGYESLASIYALGSNVDIWLPDFKYASNDFANEMSGNLIKNYVDIAIEAIDAMLSFIDKPSYDNFKQNLRMTSGIIVRHLLLPGHLENSKNCLKILFENFGNEINYSIMNQYTCVLNKDSKFAKDHPEFLKLPSSDDYEELLSFADNLGIKDYYWQQGGASSNSFIPEFS